MRRVLVLAIIGLFVVPVPIAGAAAVPARLDFTVIRNGTQIGTHSVTIQPQGDDTIVEVASNIAVKVAFVTAYRFVHKSRETWNGGRLRALASTTNDDGVKDELAVQASGDGLDITCNGARSTAEGDLLTGSLWNQAATTRTRLLSTIDGKPMAVTVRDRGEEAVTVRGQPVAARRYSVTGELQREVWYDRAGMLAQIHMTADDGSAVQFELR